MAVVKQEEGEDKWVRGLICEIKNQEYICALIDYGVTQSCNKIRKLPEKYINIPDFSCLCKTDSNNLKKIQVRNVTQQILCVLSFTYTFFRTKKIFYMK